MTYEYHCEKCQDTFDVIKTVKEINENEFCPHCKSEGVRRFIPSRVFFSGTRVEHAEYNPGLGEVVRNKAHREELAKRKGLIEIGNDFKSPDSIQNKFDKERAEKRAKAYEDI
jgi:putative FmdB family regulatory protein